MSGEFGKNHQGCTEYQEFVKELNLTRIIKSPAKHLLLKAESNTDFVYLTHLFCRVFIL